MKTRLLATASAVALLTACAGDGSGLDQNGRPTSGAPAVLTPEFASIQANVFTPICTTCHSGAAAPLGLRLDEGASFAMLVNTPSVQVPSSNRVVPGNPDASYLIQKLEGTAPVGGRMPLVGPALTAETIAVIRQWIADGAQPSGLATGTALSSTAAKGSEAEPASLDAAWPLQGARLSEAPREIVLMSTAELDTTLFEAGVATLRRSGGDGDFTGGNEHLMRTAIRVRSLDPTVIAFLVPAEDWTADRYELRVSGGAPVALTDRAARPIDGDGDGMPGGDFVLTFDVGQK